MAESTLSASIPSIDLQGGYAIVLEAIDPITGSAVAGVSVGSVAIYGEDVGGGAQGGVFGPFMLVPGPGAGL